ncbi:MAG TPA: Glu/Leu/Phe/Val dehydrogenase dimerization domain-containing protein [Ruania sp.]|nr:Glu/Leu/Phe/Val dehydrogenase dimerization domain-containing protein [Ruania sp.]
MTTLDNIPRAGNGHDRDDHLTAANPIDQEPYQRLTWQDEETGATGYLVVHTLVCGLATGGLRMRPGCTMHEVEDLARGMATKTATFGLPVGGAKGGIDFDPKDERAFGVLERYCMAMRPWLDAHWVTAEDLGVTQQLIDAVFERVDLGQSFHAAIQRSENPDATLDRVHAGLASRTDDGLLLGDIIGGYGVAQACLAVTNARGWDERRTTVAIQGVGTMGGGTAWYLHEAGVPVVALADARGTLYSPAGLDVPALLDLRDAYGEIDRAGVPDDVAQLPREAVLSMETDILVPAAISYAISAENVDTVSARVVVEAANTGVLPEAEAALTAREILVIPDFVANAGAAAWAWWLLLGEVGLDPYDSFDRLRLEMFARVNQMMAEWNTVGVPPRSTALGIAAANLKSMAGVHELTIP